MEQNPSVHVGRNDGCSLQALGNKGPILRIKCSLIIGRNESDGETNQKYNRPSNVAAKVLLQAERIVRENSAFLAVDKDVSFPMPLSADGSS